MKAFLQFVVTCLVVAGVTISFAGVMSLIFPPPNPTLSTAATAKHNARAPCP